MSESILWHDNTNDGLVAALASYNRSCARRVKLEHGLSLTHWAQKLRTSKYVLYVGLLVVVSVLAFFNQQALLLVAFGLALLYFGLVGLAWIAVSFYAHGQIHAIRVGFGTSVMFETSQAWRELRRELAKQNMTPEEFLERITGAPERVARIVTRYLGDVVLNTKRSNCGQLTEGSAQALSRLASETVYEVRRL